MRRPIAPGPFTRSTGLTDPMRADLESRSASILEAMVAALPPARPFGDAFATEVFIGALSSLKIDLETATVLEALAKKVEVGRKLRLAYTVDLAKQASDLCVAPAYAEALAAAYVHFGLMRKDWKWINTALKMEWGILQEPAFQMPQPIAELLVALLEEQA